MDVAGVTEIIYSGDREDVLIGDVYAEATSISMPARDAEVEAVKAK